MSFFFLYFLLKFNLAFRSTTFFFFSTYRNCLFPQFPGVAKNGAFKYDDGTKYVGDWNNRGLKHGAGALLLPDGTRYDGAFQNGLCSGLGVIIFPDGAK